MKSGDWQLNVTQSCVLKVLDESMTEATRVNQALSPPPPLSFSAFHHNGLLSLLMVFFFLQNSLSIQLNSTDASPEKAGNWWKYSYSDVPFVPESQFVTVCELKRHWGDTSPIMVQAELHGVTITHRFITIFVKKKNKNQWGFLYADARTGESHRCHRIQKTYSIKGFLFNRKLFFP